VRPLWAALTVALFLLSLASSPTSRAADKSWTVLVYMDADNNLEDVGIEDFLEMSAVGSTPDVNVVVQMDRTPGFESTYGDWTSARRFYVTAGMEPDAPGTDLGEVNMADPAELVSFVNWGIGNYPATHYFLVLWDHGDGWQGVVVDDDPVIGDRLNATELRTAMDAIVAANGRRIDLLGNDACRMTLEIQYELADFVDYFVGSEKDEPKEGWPYTPFLQALTADPAMGPGDVARTLVDAYVGGYEGVALYSVALSAVSAAGLRPFVGALNPFLEELMAHLPFYTQEVLAARGATDRFEESAEDYDLWHFVENVLAEVPSPRLARRAEDLRIAFHGAVEHERHWDNPSPANGVHAANAHGMSLYFFPVGGNPEYLRLALSRDSLWDEFLATFSTGSRPQVAWSVEVAAVDGDSDGLDESLRLSATAGANGTGSVDVYCDGAYVASREWFAVENRTDNVSMAFSVGGICDVTAYLFAGGVLQNVTARGGLAVEEIVTFRGRVNGSDGRPVDGAAVTITNERTGEVAQGTTEDGAYAVSVVYPTWFREGDPIRIDIVAGDRRVGVQFNATLPEAGTSERVIVRDVSFGAADLGSWYAAFILVTVVAALGVTFALLSWRRNRKLLRIP